MFGFNPMHVPDLDAPDELDFSKLYSDATTAAEKARLMIESSRSQFYQMRAMYLECRVGGRRHQATLDGFGPKTADALAKNIEARFEQMRKNALLDEDGNTTDATMPTTRMVNAELRRLRANAHLMVAQHVHFFETMMPEHVAEWTLGEYLNNGLDLKTRYTRGCYQDFYSFMSCFKLRPISTAQLETKFRQFYDERTKHGNLASEVCPTLRVEIADYICSVLPHNEARLQKEMAAAEKMGAVH